MTILIISIVSIIFVARPHNFSTRVTLYSCILFVLGTIESLSRTPEHLGVRRYIFVLIFIRCFHSYKIVIIIIVVATNPFHYIGIIIVQASHPGILRNVATTSSSFSSIFLSCPCVCSISFDKSFRHALSIMLHF